MAFLVFRIFGYSLLRFALRNSITRPTFLVFADERKYISSPDLHLHHLRPGRQSTKVSLWEVSGGTHLLRATECVPQQLTSGHLSNNWEVSSGLGNPLQSRRSILTRLKFPCHLDWDQLQIHGPQPSLRYPAAAASRSRHWRQVDRETRWRLCLVEWACVKEGGPCLHGNRLSYLSSGA